MNNIKYRIIFEACLIGIVYVAIIRASMVLDRLGYEQSKSDMVYISSPGYCQTENTDEVVKQLSLSLVNCVECSYNSQVAYTSEPLITDTEENLIEMCVPENNDFYSYMDYRFITTGDQYELQTRAYTDYQGIRRVGDDVCVAMGSYYGTEIGTRYIITTDTGNSYTAILSDCKADCHTDINNQYCLTGNGKKNIIEFVVDTDCLNNNVVVMGNVGVYDNYNGEIIKIEKLN